MDSIRIGIIGDFDPALPVHVLTNEAIEHASRRLALAVDVRWLPTDETHDLGSLHGLWCSPGSPYKSLDGALRGVRFAREQRIPFLGTCAGFQHAVLEYGRNVMGVKDATHAEYDPYASVLFVKPLSCSLVGKTMSLCLKPESRAARIYGKNIVEEAYYCNFGLNPEYQQALDDAGLRVSGIDVDGEARVVELPDHPFFLATLFVPQGRSTAESPHPLIEAFLHAAASAAR